MVGGGGVTPFGVVFCEGHGVTGSSTSETSEPGFVEEVVVVSAATEGSEGALVVVDSAGGLVSVGAVLTFASFLG